MGFASEMRPKTQKEGAENEKVSQGVTPIPVFSLTHHESNAKKTFEID